VGEIAERQLRANSCRTQGSFRFALSSLKGSMDLPIIHAWAEHRKYPNESGAVPVAIVCECRPGEKKMDRAFNRLVLSFQERQNLPNVVFGWAQNTHLSWLCRKSASPPN
jgi:hypothetical protein